MAEKSSDTTAAGTEAADADAQEPGRTPEQPQPVDFWEERYAASERIWSGRVNVVLADIAGALDSGRALDLGCGEGADVIWLAGQGWEATGIDISPTAIARASAAAAAAGLAPDRAQFLAADLAAVPAGVYDLVTASFFHSPVELPREDILRQAAERVAPGGHLLITSHAGSPPWAEKRHGHEHCFPSPQEELELLALEPDAWEVVLAETRPRNVTAPDGSAVILDDGIVLLRRR